MAEAKYSKEQLLSAYRQMRELEQTAIANITKAVVGLTYTKKSWFIFREEIEIVSFQQWTCCYWEDPKINTGSLIKTKKITQRDYEDWAWLPHKIGRTSRYLQMANKSHDGLVTLDQYEFEYFKDYLRDKKD